MGAKHLCEIWVLYFWSLTNSFSHRRSVVTFALASCNKSTAAGADDPMPTVYGFGGGQERRKEGFNFNELETNLMG